VREALGEATVSERRVCQVLGQPRSTQRRARQVPDDEAVLTEWIVDIATQYGRYGYRRVTGMLRNEGFVVNHKRVERIWRREGLKVPQRQPKRGRLWLNDGSCVRLRPEYRNHVWSYDFVAARTSNGRPLRLLNIIDEYTRECLAIRVARNLTSENVLEELHTLFVWRGAPEYLRSDNGSEFTAHKVRDWLGRVAVKTAFIEPGSPAEHGSAWKTATSSLSTASWVTNCLTPSCSTRCWRPRCWWSAGVNTTITCARTAPWATDHRRQRRG
jgi:putative transposase